MQQFTRRPIDLSWAVGTSGYAYDALEALGMKNPPVPEGWDLSRADKPVPPENFCTPSTTGCNKVTATYASKAAAIPTSVIIGIISLLITVFAGRNMGLAALACLSGLYLIALFKDGQALIRTVSLWIAVTVLSLWVAWFGGFVLTRYILTI